MTSEGISTATADGYQPGLCGLSSRAVRLIIERKSANGIKRCQGTQRQNECKPYRIGRRSLCAESPAQREQSSCSFGPALIISGSAEIAAIPRMMVGRARRSRSLRCHFRVCENRRHSGLSRIHRSRSLHQSLARGVHRTGRPTTRTMLLSSSTSPSPSRSAVACGRSSRKAVPPSPLPVAGIKHDTIDGFSRVPLARNFDFGGALHSRCQNKKYLCAIGSTSAGAQVSSSPLAVTS